MAARLWSGSVVSFYKEPKNLFKQWVRTHNSTQPPTAPFAAVSADPKTHAPHTHSCTTYTHSLPHPCLNTLWATLTTASSAPTGGSGAAAGAAGLNAMKLLMEALQSEEVEGRIEAMASLRAIAVNLGPEKTRKELIPYLAGNVCVCVCAHSCSIGLLCVLYLICSRSCPLSASLSLLAQSKRTMMTRCCWQWQSL